MILIFKPILSFLFIFTSFSEYQWAPDRTMNQVYFSSENSGLNEELVFNSTYSYALFEGSHLSIYGENKNTSFEKIIIQTRINDGFNYQKESIANGTIAIKKDGRWYSQKNDEKNIITIDSIDFEERKISGTFQFKAFSIDSHSLFINEGKFRIGF